MTVPFRDIDPDDLKRRLEIYYEVYYAELREMLSRYSMILEDVPDFLKGSKSVLATICTDGVLVTHWSAPQDRFALGVSTRTVHEIRLSQTLTPGQPGFLPQFEIDPESTENLEYQLAEFRLHEGTDTSGPVVWEPPWQRQDIAILHSVEDDQWSADHARQRAREDVLTFANARLMGLHLVEPQRQRDEVVAKLEDAIREFRELLDTEPREEEVQRYLSEDRNKILLHTEAVSVSPKVQLAEKYVPDFVIELPRQRYIYVEIEHPQHTVITQTGRPSAKLTDANQQVEDWFRWTSDNIAYARTILPGISEPDGMVILGRASGIPAKHADVLARRNAEAHRIETMTYDDLLENAEQHLENLRKITVS